MHNTVNSCRNKEANLFLIPSYLFYADSEFIHGIIYWPVTYQ